ncbi:MAG: hypothetical protein WCB85_12695 [Candidatus Dormiibacterota bacterium]
MQMQVVLVLATAAAVLIAVVALAVSLHRASPPPTAPAGTPSASDASPSTAATSASTSADEVAIGVTETAPAGATIDLLAYSDHFAPGSLINNPLPAGGFYAAADLRICATTAAGVDVSPFAFVMVEPDKSQVGIASGPGEGLQPALALQQMAPGQCVSGWLSYGVSARPTALEDTVDGLSWPIP